MQTHYFSEKNLNLAKVKDLLEDGGVIAFPTETVYGLGALISQEKAIVEIYNLKKRSSSKALTIHASRIEDVLDIACDIPEDFYRLANHFLPGPLTIILKKNKRISNLISPYDTIGFRIPASSMTLELLNSLNEPMVGTSANISQAESPIYAKEVHDSFNGQISCIIDGGKCPIGVASTIVSLVGEIKILRSGFITKEQLERVLNKKIL
jgi:L-threonylcarbamoyladenylate synthase